MKTERALITDKGQYLLKKLARVGINGERQNSYKIMAIHVMCLLVSVVGSMGKI